LVKADLTDLKASEKDVIDRVIEQMSDWSASAISNYSHRDMPWLASKEGEEINYDDTMYIPARFEGYKTIPINKLSDKMLNFILRRIEPKYVKYLK
jgi:hypothetical protein